MLNELRLEINKACNYACVHCYTDKRSYEALGIEKVRRLLEDAVAAGTTELSLTGGEPLLEWRYVRDVAAAAKAHGMRVRLNTNGHLLSSEVVAALAPLVEEFQVSLNAAEDQAFDAFVRRRNAFHKVVDGIKRLVAAGSYVAVRFTLMGKTAAHLVPTYALCQEIGVRAFKVRSVVPAGSVASSVVASDVDLMRAAAHELFRVAAESTVTVRFNDGGGGIGIPEGQANVAPMPCRCGSEALFVGADGKVAPCVFLRDYAEHQLGDVNVQSIVDIHDHSPGLRTFMEAATTCSSGGGCAAVMICESSSEADPIVPDHALRRR